MFFEKMKAPMQNNSITLIFKTVNDICNPPLRSLLLEWIWAKMIIRVQAIAFLVQSVSASGKIDIKYDENVIAAKAVGAEKPIVAETQPDTKPAHGW